MERRSQRGQDRVFYLDESGCLRSIPGAFTSLATPDVAAAIGAGRAHFRVGDLLALTRLMEERRQ